MLIMLNITFMFLYFLYFYLIIILNALYHIKRPSTDPPIVIQSVAWNLGTAVSAPFQILPSPHYHSNNSPPNFVILEHREGSSGGILFTILNARAPTKPIVIQSAAWNLGTPAGGK
jgi:hypothetical protein